MLWPDRPEMTIRRMRFTCWITKATDIKSEYVIIIDLSHQNGYANVRQYYVYPYTARLVCNQQGMRLLLGTSLIFKYNSGSNLLLPKGQTGEAWNPSKRHYSSRNRGILNVKLLAVRLQRANTNVPGP